MTGPRPTGRAWSGANTRNLAALDFIPENLRALSRDAEREPPPAKHQALLDRLAREEER